MTDTDIQARPPLGVGAILSESFSLVIANFVPIMSVAAIPAILGILINLLVYGPVSLNPAIAFTDPLEYLEATAGVPFYMQIVITVLTLVLWGIATAAVTQMAYSVKSGGQASVNTGLGVAVSQIVPILLCMIIAAIAIYIGILLLILPGLYLSAMWLVLIPAIVVDRVGFGAFGRSAQLSQEYRWPLVGLLILYALVLIVLGVVSAGLQFLFASVGSVGLILSAVSGVVVAAFIYAVGGALVAIVYARLREIKEGVAVSSLAEVFS